MEVIFFSPKRLKKNSQPFIGPLATNNKPTIRNLGHSASSLPQLNFMPHVNNLIKSCYYPLSSISKLNQSCRFQTRRLLGKAYSCLHLFTSGVLLYNALLPHPITSDLAPANTECCCTNFNSEPFSFSLLHWLLVRIRIAFKILLAFKLQHCLVPSYVNRALDNECLELPSEIIQHTLVPWAQLVTQGNWAFAISAQRIYKFSDYSIHCLMVFVINAINLR